jgi:hypothetical protein
LETLEKVVTRFRTVSKRDGDLGEGIFDALCNDAYGNLGACGTGDFNTGTPDESYFWEYDNKGAIRRVTLANITPIIPSLQPRGLH